MSNVYDIFEKSLMEGSHSATDADFKDPFKTFDDPYEGLQHVVLTIESALKDLNQYEDKDIQEKYASLITYSMYKEEGLTTEGALTIIGDGIIYTLERIWLFIKKIWASGYNYIRKIYAGFKAKRADINFKINLDSISNNVIKSNLPLFINSNGNLDFLLVSQIFSVETVKDITDRLFKLNNEIIIAFPSKSMLEQEVTGQTSSVNDALASFRNTVKSKYNDIMFGSFKEMDVLNKNIVFSDIKSDMEVPYIYSSDGLSSYYVHLLENGVVKSSKCGMRKEVSYSISNFKTTLSTINNKLDEIKEGETFKSIVDADFKVWDNVYKNTQGYINQMKTHKDLNNKLLFTLNNNLSTIFNVVLNSSLNRIALLEKLKKLS